MTKTPITEAWKENQQYELIPGEHNNWKVRILEGEYIETVISYGGLSIDETRGIVKFDLNLDYSPVGGITSDDIGLQRVAGHILHSILVNAFDEH